MTHYSLEFGNIIILQPDIAEVIIKEGIEMDEAMVDTYHQFLLNKLSAPFSLLVNKIHRYTYSFHAQLKLATIPEIHSMAVVTYSHISEVATQSLYSLPRNTPWNLRTFASRDEALQWLKQNQASLTDKDASTPS
ncbi:MAG: hypothetical protein EP315_05765 [Gammaproteobacteria bacterium]|nr:MAG: hypothetical protein EP315_05765 [Gammaproteobacteria bacterium]